MAYPLGGVALNGALELMTPGTNNPVEFSNPTYDWNQNLSNDLYPPWNRAFGVEQLSFFSILDLELEAVRQWNGIGGTVYLPSFPQLERHETSWPHAT